MPKRCEYCGRFVSIQDIVGIGCWYDVPRVYYECRNCYIKRGGKVIHGSNRDIFVGWKHQEDIDGCVEALKRGGTNGK
jgi:hypothetical protein